MSKAMTFSRQFPKGHPRFGDDTHFVESILNSQYIDYTSKDYFNLLMSLNPNLDPKVISDFWIQLFGGVSEDFKVHTIRAGSRWKVGEKFSPRVWSGKPYASKQIIIGPDIEIKKIWEFGFDFNGVPVLDGFYLEDIDTLETIAKNDGLSEDDFIGWFKSYPKKNRDDNSFTGQILCWNESINY